MPTKKVVLVGEAVLLKRHGPPAKRKSPIRFLKSPPPTLSDLGEKDQEDDRKKTIGDLGEALVLEFERSLLLQASRPDLANKVTHVAVVEGDCAGYDIRSYDLGGDVKYIEVKTTTLGRATAFFLSENERAFGEKNAGQYYIYRLFELDENLPGAKFYVVPGDPGQSFLLKPTAYRALLMLKGESN